MKYLIILLVCIANASFAQVEVIKNEYLTKNKGSYNHPVLSPDNSYVAFTKKGYKGLYYMDIQDGTITTISTENGAGYNPAFSAKSDKLYYITHQYKGLKKYSDINVYDISEDKNKVLLKGKQNLSPPAIMAGNLIYRTRSKINQQKIRKNTNTNEIKYVEAFDKKILIYTNDKKHQIQPKGEGHYIWPALSPDQERMVFTKTGDGTYVCNTKGKIIADLGKLNAPTWLNNDYIIGMIDEDDGKRIVKSDIYIMAANGSYKKNLTSTEEKKEMYPECSGNNVVYHTLAGDIYLMKLKIDK